ncbi:hypothetical protein F25303_13252 [Fusarium sp. NRRL 25303]|nr:hypothetical protein F25303_13252 [Fusarium sp. NRRL 25303]
MGDPFSIATGVAGLISLGITVCDGLHTYFSAIKDRKDDLAIVAQNVALFKFHVFAVQSSASKLGHRHSPAIDGLQLSLINCEMQLQYLQKLLNELMPTEDPSLFKEIWRRQKLIARYPFDRKKLVQLEEYLTRANTTLSSFIQALNLDLNIRMGDELEAFRTSLEALDINTQATLRTIATRLDVSPKVEPITLQLLPSRIEDVTASSSNSIGLHQNGVSVAETKTSYSGNRRYLEDITNSHSTPRYLQNAELEQRLCKKLADMDWNYELSTEQETHHPLTSTDMVIILLTYACGDIFTQSTLSTYYLWILPRLHKLVTNRDSDFYNAELAHKVPLTSDIMSEDGESSVRQLSVLYIGFTELFMAVIKKDERRLQAILAEENNVLNLSQMDLYRRNILHASSNWPDGLRLLLQRQDTRSLMDMASESSIKLRPLDYALFYSKIYCNAPDQWTECDDCTCYLAVQVLLEADCNVTIDLGRPETLACCSLRARRLFFEHLKDRRERLRNLAIAILPEEILGHYGVTANSLPNKSASFLWWALQGAKEKRDQPAVDLNDSLKPYYGEGLVAPKGFFCLPHRLENAVLALNYGLAPEDEDGVPTLFSGYHIIPGPLSGGFANRVSIDYLDWILRGDWKEILDEDRELIDQLEALDEEFEDVFDRQNVSIAEFLFGYWLTRMEEVIQELHKPLTHHDRYELLEAGVVLEEDNADGSECCEDMIYVR